MASLAKRLSLFFFLVTLLFALQIHARDSQLFNKISTNNKESPALNNQKQEEPNFLPENEDSYGLYGHETGQLPPSTAAGKESHKQPLNKYLPKNYNAVSYVTEPDPDDIDNTLTNNNDAGKYHYDAAPNYQREQEETAEYRSFPANTNYNNLGSSFNSEPHVKETGFGNGFQPQGMSDTRLLENGKYYYDVQTDKYNMNHPYERLKSLQTTRNVYGNMNYYHKSSADNAEEFKFDNRKYDDVGGYDENQAEFRNEESNPMP